MKAKRIGTFACFALLLAVLAACGKAAPPLSMPAAEDVLEVQVSKGDAEASVADPVWVDELLSQLAASKPTKRQSVNDASASDDALLVTVTCADEADSRRFYVYPDGYDCFVELPYEGIWRTTPEAYAMLYGALA